MPREHTDPATAGLYDAGGDHARPGPAEARGAGLRTLAGLLRAAGLDPSPEEIADALWLAARTREAARAASPGAGEGPEPEPARRRPARAQGSPGRAGGPSPPADAEEPPTARAREDDPAEDPVRLYPAGALAAADPAPDTEVPVAGGVPVRVPGAAALPRILDIQRALRALQRHRPPGPPTRTVLDEPATAEASARALGLVLPVFRPECRREATVRLVMDASPSMAVWQDMFDELRAVCERLGAFRDVQVHYLHRLPDGTAAVGRGPAPAAGVRSGDQLRDPTGRALTMVVSDCAGPVWREGEAQRLLHRWAECAPCVVVQPLPQRLWNRSWLPTERGVLERGPAGGGATPGGTGGGRGLRFRPDRPARPGRPTGGLTVPVLPPSATALGAWARLVAGLGSGPVPAEVGRVLARHPAAPVPLPRTARPPRELVRRFRSSAAPGAVQLAVYLSAAPLTLPVMRLVQRTMLPDSEPSDLAEVLLSGLLRRSGASPGPWYEFVPGVQDVLLGPLGRDEAALVLKHCSEYVLAHFGRGVRNFPALAVSQLTGVPEGVPDVPDAEQAPAGPLPQAFAQVSAKVVRRYLPGPPEEDPAPAPAPVPPGRAASVRAARGRLLLAEADGDARHLHDAAALLRRAAALPPGPEDPPEEAETELAGVLLRLWAVQRDPELLDEAERAVTGLRTAGGWAALGRVLYERGLASGTDGDALLAAAAREFAAAGAAAGAAAAQDAELRVDCAVRRARTLIRLSELRAEPGPLYEALAALEPLATDPRTTHPDVLLALGATLLALLARTPSPPDRTALAERAAEALERALALLEAAPVPPGPGRPGGQEDPARRGPGPAPEAYPGTRPGAGAPAGGGSAEAAGTGGTAGTAGEGAEAADGPGSGASARTGAAAPDGPRHGGTEGSTGDGRTGAGRPGSPDDGGAGAPEKAGRSGGDRSAASEGDGASAPTARTDRPGAGLPHSDEDTPTTGDTAQVPERDGGAAARPDSPRVEAPDLDEAAPAPGAGAEGGPASAGAGPGGGARGGTSGRVADGASTGTGAGADRADGPGGPAGEPASAGAGTNGGRDGGSVSAGASPGDGARGGASDPGTDRVSTGAGVAGDGGGGAPRAEGARAGEPDRGGTADGEGAGGADGRAHGPRTGASDRSGDTPAARAASAPGAASAPRADAADRGGAGASAGESAPAGAGEAGRAGEAGWAGGGVRGRDGGRGRRIAWVRVELAGALRYLPGRLEEARAQLLRALQEGVGEPELRLAALLCLARVHRARYDRDGEPVALEEAAEAYARARRLIPRDGDAYAGLLPEWGDVLLERARAADGRRFSSTAVRVLRESRSAVAQSDPGASYRLLRLASGLRLRHAYEGDLVDLREAEYLLELAVRQSRRPLERARAWRDHGDVQQEIHAHTRTADRLDRAADSYRRAWRAALEAGRDDPDDTGAALRLAARVQELRGGALERLARPRAALDAYRAALELWQRQGLADGERAGAVRARIHALEAGG
ncbi:SAV_2336 N-terminal domain-related protein [Streptomyces sp. NPDC127112]|uniref:SAV_2336 N-terminal domain-related protein n=1 Tax=Streptomyces sp. NPDC127112 TaxID=3345364 RepID=UPI00363E7F20